MLRLDSDWIRPVTVTLTNATVSSSEVIGSACHVTKIIDEQTVHLIAPMKHEPKGGVGGIGNAVIDLGSSSHDIGSGDLGPESTVVDPGCSDTDTGNSVGDTRTNDHEPVCSPCHPGNDSGGQISVLKWMVGDPGNKICDSKTNVLDTGSIVCHLGSGVHGSDNVPTDASKGVRDLGSCSNDSGSNIHDRESRESDAGNAALEQGCDIGRCKSRPSINAHNIISTSQLFHYRSVKDPFLAEFCRKPPSDSTNDSHLDF